MNKYITEFIGTFFLVLAIGLAVVSANPAAPLAIGAALTALIYMGGHISGAHYNPAVTMAFYMRRKMDAADIAPYVVAQLVGAVLATAVVHRLVGETFAVAPARTATPVLVLTAEVLFTFALVLVILNVAIARGTEGNEFYGLAIGLTVVAGAYAVGDISGAAFNPAVGTGPILYNALMGLGGIGNLWYYWVGPLIGSALAVGAFALQNPEG